MKYSIVAPEPPPPHDGACGAHSLSACTQVRTSPFDGELVFVSTSDKSLIDVAPPLDGVVATNDEPFQDKTSQLEIPAVLTSVKSFIAAEPDAKSVPGAHSEPLHFRTCPVLGAVDETFDNPLNVEFNEITPELI